MTWLNTKLWHTLRACFILAALAVSLPATAQTLYNVEWTNLNGVTFNASNATLTKTAAKGWNAGALSPGILASGADGYVRYDCTSDDVQAGYHKMIGLATYNTDPGYSATEYACIINQAKLFIYESGTYIGYFGKVAAGDKIIVERSGSNILYKKGTSTVRTVSTTASNELYADASLYWNGTTIVGVQATFRSEYTVNTSVVKADCVLGTTGSITLTPSGGDSPYTYTWAHGPTSSSLTGLDAGTYAVTVEDNSGDAKYLEIDVDSKVGWYNTQDVALNAEIIRKSTGNDWSSGSGNTTNNLGPAEEGALIYPWVGGDGPKLMGFRKQENVGSTDIKTLDYALWLAPENVSVMLAGTIVAYFTKPQAGDVFKVARIGSKIYFYRNGRSFFDVATNADWYLVGEVSLRDQYAQFDGVTAAFCFGSIGATTTASEADEGAPGTATVQPVGGVPPFTIIWDPSTTTEAAIIDSLVDDSVFGAGATFAPTIGLSTRGGMVTGDYFVRVEDANGATSTQRIPIGAPKEWINSVGVTISGSEVESDGTTGWGNNKTTLTNAVEADQKGAISFVVDPPGLTAAVGFREYTANQATTYSDLDFAIYVENNSVHVYELGTQYSNLSTTKPGAELRIERDGTTINYYNEHQLIRTSTAGSATATYFTDVGFNGAGKIEKVIVTRFTHKPQYTATVVPIDCENGIPGNITVSAKSSIYGPTTYSWQDAAGNAISNQNPLAAIQTGTYWMTAAQPANYIGNTINTTLPFEMSSTVEWNPTTSNFIAAPGTVNCGATGASVPLASGLSTNTLFAGADGWVEFKVGTVITGSRIYLGFTTSSLVSTLFGAQAAYLFSIYVDANGASTLFIQHWQGNGLSAAKPIKVGGIRPNQLLRVNRNLAAGVVEFMVDGVVIYTQPCITGEMRIGAQLAYSATSIVNVQTSLPCPDFETKVSYASLEPLPTSGYTVAEQGFLRFHYEEEYANATGNLDFAVYNDAHVEQSAISQSSMTPTAVDFGANWLTLNVGSLSPGYYLLEVTDQKNATQYLRFKR